MLNTTKNTNTICEIPMQSGKTIINHLASRSIGIILFLNFLFIANTEKVLAQYPTLSAINFTTPTLGNASCPGGAGPTNTNMYVKTGDLISFSIAVGTSSCTRVSLSGSGYCGSSGCQGISGSWNCQFNTPGNYQFTASCFTNTVCNSTVSCAGSMTINVHVSACPFLNAVNLTNSCAFPYIPQLNGPYSTSIVDMTITIGDEIKFMATTSLFPNESVHFDNSSCGSCFPSPPLGYAFLPTQYQATFPDLGDYAVTAHFQNSNCTFTFMVHVKGFFEPATVSRADYSPPVVLTANTVNTGNDKAAIPNFACEVSVWDGSNPRLGWHVTEFSTSYKGNMSLGSAMITDATDPDVALVFRACSPSVSTIPVYAVAVYYSPSQNNYFMQTFQYNTIGNSFQNLGVPIALNTPPQFTPHTINIDKNDYISTTEGNHFVIVWQDDMNNILCRTGRVNPATTCEPEVPCILSPPTRIATSASMPDVALFWNGFISGSPAYLETVLLTYVSTLTNKLVVDYFDYSSFASCPATLFAPLHNYTSPTPGAYGYRYPRIAAANTTGFVGFPGSNPPSQYIPPNNWSCQWTVAVEDNTGTPVSPQWLIKGFTVASGIVMTAGGPPDVVAHTYNDGAIILDSPFDISARPNLRPVVSYTNDSKYNFTGWTFDNVGNPSPYYYSDDGARDAKYPIVLVCDNKGQIPGCLRYWDVPLEFSALQHQEKYKSLSVAGRYVTDNLYTWYFEDDNTGSAIPNVFYKSVPQSTTPALRTEPSAAKTEQGPNIYPNPVMQELTVSGAMENSIAAVYNLIGEQVLRVKLGAGNNRINTEELANGIYILKIVSPIEELQWQYKLIKM